jgi:hypothetical protein
MLSKCENEINTYNKKKDVTLIWVFQELKVGFTLTVAESARATSGERRITCRANPRIFSEAKFLNRFSRLLENFQPTGKVRT